MHIPIPQGLAVSENMVQHVIPFNLDTFLSAILHMQSWPLTAKRLFVGGGAVVGAVGGGAVGVGIATAVKAVSFVVAVRSKTATATCSYVYLICVHSCVDSHSCHYWYCSNRWCFVPDIKG